jgi:hypothetical protein
MLLQKLYRRPVVYSKKRSTFIARDLTKTGASRIAHHSSL